MIEEETLCNWCGDVVCLETEYSAELVCGSKICGRHLYHQACVEEHLKKNAFRKAERLTGFPCPRGAPGSKFMEGQMEPCRGTINSTHKKMPCKNKKKKQAAALAAPAAKAVPHPAPAPKPAKAAVPDAAQVAAARLTAHLAQRPTPVRGGAAPGAHAAAARPVVATKAHYMEIAAQLRMELGVGGRYDATAALAAAKPALVAAAAAAVAKPAAAGKGRQQRAVEAACIPGMEYVAEQPKRKAVAAVLSPAPKQFNLQETAFPSLPGGHANHAAPVRRLGECNGRINAMDPNHAAGFVTDLDRYNALIGVSEQGSDDDEDTQLGVPRGPSSSDGGSAGMEPAEELPPDLSLVSETTMALLVQLAVVYDVEYGVEQAGLPASYVPLVRELIALLPAEMVQDMREEAYRGQLTPEQQAAADRAAYMEAERIVLEGEAQAERERQGAQRSPRPDYVPANYAAQAPMLAPAFVVPQPMAPAFVAPAPLLFQQPSYHPYGKVSSQMAVHDPQDDEVDVDELLALCLS